VKNNTNFPFSTAANFIDLSIIFSAGKALFSNSHLDYTANGNTSQLLAQHATDKGAVFCLCP